MMHQRQLRRIPGTCMKLDTPNPHSLVPLLALFCLSPPLYSSDILQLVGGVPMSAATVNNLHSIPALPHRILAGGENSCSIIMLLAIALNKRRRCDVDLPPWHGLTGLERPERPMPTPWPVSAALELQAGCETWQRCQRWRRQSSSMRA